MPENLEKYIQLSKTIIDDYVKNNNYEQAFTTLLLILNNLGHQERTELLRYYTEKYC